MGTLIPLGPALNGLAKGDMQALSGNLIVAFTATVISRMGWDSPVAYGMHAISPILNFLSSPQRRERRYSMGNRRHSRRRLWDEMDEDHGAGLLNLYDVWIAFAVALLLAVVAYMRMPELISSHSDITMVKNPGTPQMEIIQKKGEKIEHYRVAAEQLTWRRGEARNGLPTQQWGGRLRP